jgi:hypothetical protein
MTIPEAVQHPVTGAAADAAGVVSYTGGVLAIVQDPAGQGWVAVLLGLAVLVLRGWQMLRTAQREQAVKDAEALDHTWQGRARIEHAATLVLRDELDKLTVEYARMAAELEAFRCPFAAHGAARCAGSESPVPLGPNDPQWGDPSLEQAT